VTDVLANLDSGCFLYSGFFVFFLYSEFPLLKIIINHVILSLATFVQKIRLFLYASKVVSYRTFFYYVASLCCNAETVYSVSQNKNNPLRFSDIFSKTVGNF